MIASDTAENIRPIFRNSTAYLSKLKRIIPKSIIDAIIEGINNFFPRISQIARITSKIPNNGWNIFAGMNVVIKSGMYGVSRSGNINISKAAKRKQYPSPRRRKNAGSSLKRRSIVSAYRMILTIVKMEFFLNGNIRVE